MPDRLDGLMALLRADIWPHGELALYKVMQDLKGLEASPSTSDFEDLGEPWRPWRSDAARLRGHHSWNPAERLNHRTLER